MRWAITGTPGTGKTTAVGQIRLDRPIIHLNELIAGGEYRLGRDDDRNTAIADIEGLRAWLGQQPDDLVIESHLAHHLPVDRVVVLRCDPTELRRRLTDRHEGSTRAAKIEENVESERLDLILAEAVETHDVDAVYEIDTTGKPPEHVARAIEDAVHGRRPPAVGTVSFLEDEP